MNSVININAHPKFRRHEIWPPSPYASRLTIPKYRLPLEYYKPGTIHPKDYYKDDQ